VFLFRKKKICRSARAKKQTPGTGWILTAQGDAGKKRNAGMIKAAAFL
jgi:hypothetical protein